MCSQLAVLGAAGQCDFNGMGSMFLLHWLSMCRIAVALEDSSGTVLWVLVVLRCTFFSQS